MSEGSFKASGQEGHTMALLDAGPHPWLYLNAERNVSAKQKISYRKSPCMRLTGPGRMIPDRLWEVHQAGYSICLPGKAFCLFAISFALTWSMSHLFCSSNWREAEADTLMSRRRGCNNEISEVRLYKRLERLQKQSRPANHWKLMLTIFFRLAQEVEVLYAQSAHWGVFKAFSHQ